MFGFLLMMLVLPKVHPSPVPKVAVVAPAPKVEPTAQAPTLPSVSPTTVPVLPPTTTTTTTIVSGIECVLTVTDGTNSVTYSPGPADSNGSCAAYPGSTPESGSVTYG